MAILKWRDAYTEDKSTLEKIKKELGTVAICETHGRTVYRGKNYIILEQNKVSNCQSNDYFIIPKSLIIRGGDKVPCGSKRKKRKKRKKK